MKITNLDTTAKIINHLAGKSPTIESIVEKVENKTILFTPDKIVFVEAKYDSNKDKIKAGDKISIEVETGEITILERSKTAKAEDTKPTQTAAKEGTTRSAGKNFFKEMQ